MISRQEISWNAANSAPVSPARQPRQPSETGSEINTDVAVYFCDPRSPWQRGTNENTNGLLRQYSPKGTNPGLYSADDLAAVASTLNGRPCKTLGWRTPAETFDALLRSDHTGVATTG